MTGQQPMNTDLSKAPAVAGPVELPVRPVAWLCEYRSGEEFVSLASDPMRDPDVMSAVPLVTLSSCNAAAAAERERWVSLVLESLEVMEHHRSEHAQGHIAGLVASLRRRMNES